MIYEKKLNSIMELAYWKEKSEQLLLVRKVFNNSGYLRGPNVLLLQSAISSDSVS